MSSDEQRYRGLIDRLDAIFWESGIESLGFTYVSPRAEPLLGYPLHRWTEEPDFWVRILHPDDRGWVLACCQRAVSEGRDNDFEYRALAADGRVVWLRDLVHLERDESGRPMLLRGIMFDVTAQKRVEAELRESSAAKDRFLDMLAHELRNPLAALSSALQVLRGTSPAQPAWERAMQVLERQVRHQAQLLNDLLQVSRLQRGAIEIHPRRIDLGQLARETVEDHREAAERAGLALSLDLPAEPLWIDGDPAQLAVALSNLLGNALKFTERGGRVEVTARQEDGRGARARVAVADSGIGIAADMLPRVWDAFSQADNSLERSRGGLGLGLSLARGIVELHGGEVLAESPGLGGGARFSFALPLAEDQAAAARPREEAGAAPAQPGGLRILIIEDNVDAAETLRDLLEIFGHAIEAAHTGAAGIESARRFLPEVVLCDIGLPGMDGYAVARALRQDPATASARLVALTGYGRDSDRQRSEEAGFDLHLVKPVAPADLQSLLAGWAAER